MGQGRSRPKARVLVKYLRLTASPVGVTSTGHVALMTGYPMGNSEYQRSTNSTLTYGMYCRFAFQIYPSIITPSQELIVHNWFIRDMAPSDAYPSVTDIFQGASPWVYSVQHDLKRRYIVMKEFKVTLYSTGAVSSVTSIGPAAHCVGGKKFFWKPNITTHWKNNATATLGDIESGAMLWVSIVSSGVPGQSEQWTKINVYYDHSLYFKSV